MRDIFECKVMIVDMKNWPLFNKIYTLFFDGHRLPARSAFGVADLALGRKVEVTCQAARTVSLVGKMQYVVRSLFGK
ncbi:MAG: RidA family protein [Verrucomicrobia bacterium]|nr:RidA family protein [Verrucomicrobiota bacterium]